LAVSGELHTPREIAPGNDWVGGWVGPITGLDDVEKIKFLTLAELELRPLGRAAHSQSLSWVGIGAEYVDSVQFRTCPFSTIAIHT
jgi:hypothetical protein